MKKRLIAAVCLICAVVLGVTFFRMPTKASSASISVTADSSVKKEQEFIVHVAVSSNASMQTVDTMIRYDADVLDYLGSDSSGVAGASGMIHILDEFIDPVKEIGYDLKFKALEVGTSTITLSETYISEADTFEIIPVQSDSVTIQVNTNYQESSESRLKELLVAPGTMNEDFSPGVYQYTVDAGDADNVAISAIPVQEDAVVSMDKPEALVLGANVITITVTAPSGRSSTYTVTVNKTAVSVPETEAPAPETEAPAPETEAPAPETEAPAPETEVPAPETQAPAPETEAPAVETQAPAPETEAPAAETQAPAVETEAPAVETEAPAVETEAPAAETQAPEEG